jgi:hypothetical protein
MKVVLAILETKVNSLNMTLETDVTTPRFRLGGGKTTTTLTIKLVTCHINVNLVL